MVWLLSWIGLLMIARRMMSVSKETGGGEAPANTLLDGLISYWEMDEAANSTRVDSHGSNDLADPTNCGTRAGINSTTAADFAGTPTDYLLLASGSETDFRFGSGSWSWLTWVLFDTTAAGPVIMKYAGSGSREFALFRETASDVAFYMSPNGTTVSGVARISSGISTGVWHLFYCYYNGSEIGISLDNGTPVTASYSGGQYAGTTEIRFGDWSASTSELDGGLQKVGFWNRVLGADDVTAYYNSGNGLVYADFESS